MTTPDQKPFFISENIGTPPRLVEVWSINQFKIDSRMPLSVDFRRDRGGKLVDIAVLLQNGKLAGTFEQRRDAFEFKADLGLDIPPFVIFWQNEPPPGLNRSKSGHPEIAPNKRSIFFEVRDLIKKEIITMAIPIIKKPDSLEMIIAKENIQTHQGPLLPFTLEIQHSAINAPKTDILFVSQIFGHISSAARLLKTLPKELQQRFFLAAKHTDNVPAVLDHLQSMGLWRENLFVPLSYDDATTGGLNIWEREKAVWWLMQNPELLERFLSAKIIISDLREETAWLKAISDKLNLPQIFLNFTFAWPQHLNRIDHLPKDMAHAFAMLPPEQDKRTILDEFGLSPLDVVTDWFTSAKKFKAGVVGQVAHGADAIIDFSLAGPNLVEPNIDNCIIFPPRRRSIPVTPEIRNLWQANKFNLLVILGSGDWTERTQFVQQIINVSKKTPESQFIIVGNTDGVELPQSENFTTLGFVSPDIVDQLIQTSDLTITKPGHFSLEETAGKLTLIAPPDNLKHCNSPRSAAIAVEVVEERLTTAVEEWLSWGQPQSISPLLDISSPEAIRTKIGRALSWKNRLQTELDKVPVDGLTVLAQTLESLIKLNFQKSEVPRIIQDLKKHIHQNLWGKV